MTATLRNAALPAAPVPVKQSTLGNKTAISKMLPTHPPLRRYPNTLVLKGVAVSSGAPGDQQARARVRGALMQRNFAARS